MKVLIADDLPQGVELLEAYLVGEPYDVHTATNGEEALREIHEWRPDVVLLDVMMPRISGFEVCKQVKSDPTVRDTAVIMVTALDQPGDVDRAVEAGTDDFLTKPINKRELLLRLRAMLASRRRHPEGRSLDRTLAYYEAVQHPELVS